MKNFKPTHLALTTLAAASSLSMGCASSAKIQDRAPTVTSDGIFSFESDASGFNTKNFFYDNGEEVVVFDTQFTPEIAEKSIAFIRTKTANPITTVVITHPNPDKFNGAAAFQKIGAKVIASKATTQAIPGTHAYKKYFFVNQAKMFSPDSYPAEAHIDQTFSHDLNLHLRNGETIFLRELSHPGVSNNQTVAYIEKAHALVVGDLVHHKAHAWLEGGIKNGKATPDLAGWIEDLQELQRIFPSQTLVYGGRGESAFLDEATTEQIHYLQIADQIVTNYVNQLDQRQAELRTDKAAAHYKELEKEFSNEFPDYKFSYMIQYGIYGLVNSKL
jgi:glyoxylase-like metal-dependent hydrolase (beta-lactamase superfamily II)